jgi:shikimate dehydrogenase
MDRYAVAGNPVEHSQSPLIHTRFAEQTGQALQYTRLLVPLDAFVPAVRAFAGSGALGCNVTVPIKFEAYETAARVTERARLAQAVNTLRFDTQGWWGDNTDGAGLVADLQRNAGFDASGRDLLLVGAGGAAAGALGPLLELKPRRIVVANRTVEKAQAVVTRHLAPASQAGVELAARPLDRCGTGFHLVVNATAASLQGGSVPVPASVLAPHALAYDMMYGPSAAGFLQWAAEQGASGRDGLGMLVEQAAEAFALWRGVRPDTSPVLAELRGASR